MSQFPYMNAIGNFLCAMICIHPDILHVVSIFNRYIGNLSKNHWQVMKLILCYLGVTSSFDLVYDRSFITGYSVIRYMDFNYVDDLYGRRSLAYYVFTLSHCIISWKAILRSIVTLFTIK